MGQGRGRAIATGAARSYPDGSASIRTGAHATAGFASALDQTPHRSVRYRRGQLIYEEGDPPAAIFRVDSGCVRLQIHGVDGHRQIVAFLFPGDLFGMCLEAHASNAEAASNVDLTRYPLQSILSTQSPAAALELVRVANAAFNDLAHHLARIAHLPAHARVLWFLGWLSHRQGRRPGARFVLPMSRRDICDFLALTPETLSRVMRVLETDGQLVAQGRRTYAVNGRRAELHERRPDDGPGRAGAAAATYGEA